MAYTVAQTGLSQIFGPPGRRTPEKFPAHPRQKPQPVYCHQQLSHQQPPAPESQQPADTGGGIYRAKGAQQGIQDPPEQSVEHRAAHPLFNRLQALGLQQGIGVQFGGQRAPRAVNIKLPEAADIFPAHLFGHLYCLIGRGTIVLKKAFCLGHGLQTVFHLGRLPFGKGGQPGKKARGAVQMQALLGHLLQPCFHAAYVIGGAGGIPVAVFGFHQRSPPFSASATQRRSRVNSS